MRKIFFFFLWTAMVFNSHAQEFKAHVQVEASAVRGSNKQMFVTLQKAIESFLNQGQWTEQQFNNHEKIKLDILLMVKSYDLKKNEINGELYFRSYRPVYNSDYETLLINLIEKNFNFKYREFEKLDFNLELYDNNLTSTLAFYAYIALGHDFDSFKENAGRQYFEKAEIIQNNAAQNGIKGWDKDHKNNSKGDLIELLLDPNSTYYHRAIYTYHRWGLDMMADNVRLGKNNIITAINYLQKFKEANARAGYLIKIFFDAKADEIVQIFSAGPPVNLTFVLNKLKNLAPNYDFKWDEIQKKAKQNTSSSRPNRRMPPGSLK